MYPPAARLVLALIIPSALFAADNPSVGTWKQSLERSSYTPGPKPRVATTLLIETAGSGEKTTVNATDADGRPITWSYIGTFDGKPFPTPTSPHGDWATITTIDSRRTEMNYTRNGKLTRTARRSVSTDGKTLTIVAIGVGAKGEQYQST